MSDVVAVIAPGEMGSAVGRRLVERGVRVVTRLDGRSKASIARAERSGFAVAGSDAQLAQEAGIVLSIVPPGAALGLAERLAPALAAAAAKPVYVDCNAVAPETAERIGAVIARTGCRYVDAGIIGPPPSASARTVFYASGADARVLARLGDRGLTVRVLDGPSAPRRRSRCPMPASPKG